MQSSKKCQQASGLVGRKKSNNPAGILLAGPALILAPAIDER